MKDLHTHLDSITFGGTRWKDVDVKLAGTYVDGSPVIRLDQPEEGPLATATTCLEAYGIHPAEGNVLIKNYSENEDMATALLMAGLIMPVKTHLVGHGAEVIEARVLEGAWG